MASLGTFADKVIASDLRDLNTYRIEPDSPEALPIYARWARQDLAVLLYVVNRATLIGGVLLMLIAVPLWMLVLR